MAVDLLQVTTSIQGRRLETLRFSEEKVTIGRDPACAVVFDNPGVSRLHAVITLNGDGSLTIADQRSSNGTYVNGQRISSTTLNPGDAVEVGKFSLEVRTLATPAAAVAPASPAAAAPGTPDFLTASTAASSVPEGGTVVLGAAQRERIASAARAQAQAAPQRTAPEPASRKSSGNTSILAFAAGVVVGALLMYFLA